TSWLEAPRELLVETVAFIVEELPRDPLLSLLLATGHTALFSEKMLTARSIALARAIPPDLPPPPGRLAGTRPRRRDAGRARGAPDPGDAVDDRRPARPAPHR